MAIDPNRAKGAARPLVRTKAQQARVAEKAAERAAAKQLENASTAAQANAQQLAQVVNLMIAGYSFEQIGASIGATAAEVERMLTADTGRYVRTQPALRTFVRNFISGKYTELLDAVWTEATDRQHPEKLENQDRALRILERMGRLHGADAPTQTEIKVEAAPEAVEKIVQALSAQQGLGYDVDIFGGETIPGEVVHRAPGQALAALEESSRQVEAEQEGESL